jgi:hypothetical protein
MNPYVKGVVKEFRSSIKLPGLKFGVGTGGNNSMGSFASSKDCICCFILKQNCYNLATNFVDYCQDVLKARIIKHVHNSKISVEVLSNFAVLMPVDVFAMVMGALPTFHTRSAEVHEFARERKSVVPILNKLNDFIAREMSEACMY